MPDVEEWDNSSGVSHLCAQGPLWRLPLDQVVQGEQEGLRLQPGGRLQQGRGGAAGEEQPAAGHPGGQAQH